MKMTEDVVLSYCRRKDRVDASLSNLQTVLNPTPSPLGSDAHMLTMRGKTMAVISRGIDVSLPYDETAYLPHIPRPNPAKTTRWAGRTLR